MSHSVPKQVTDSEFSVFRSLGNPIRSSVPSKLAMPSNPHRVASAAPLITPGFKVDNTTAQNTLFNSRSMNDCDPIPEEVSGVSARSYADTVRSYASATSTHHKNNNDEGHSREYTRPNCTQEEERWEKQGLLLELNNFEQQGIKLSRPYTMDDTLLQIKFEYESIRAQQEQLTKVQFAREALFLLFRGVEFANKKAGPILRLDGWSNYMAQNKTQYDNALHRIYKQYFRHSRAMSPVAELTFGISVSMFMFHLQQTSGQPHANSTNNATASGGAFGGAAGLMSSMMGGVGNMFSSTNPPPPTPPAPPPQQGPATSSDRQRRPMRKPVVFGASEPPLSQSRVGSNPEDVLPTMPSHNEPSFTVETRKAPVRRNVDRTSLSELEKAMADKDKQIEELLEAQQAQRQFFINRMESVENGRSPAARASASRKNRRTATSKPKKYNPDHDMHHHTSSEAESWASHSSCSSRKSSTGSMAGSDAELPRFMVVDDIEGDQLPQLPVEVADLNSFY